MSTGLKTIVYCGVQRILSGSDQHHVNSFGKDLKVTDVCLYGRSLELQV